VIFWITISCRFAGFVKKIGKGKKRQASFAEATFSYGVSVASLGFNAPMREIASSVWEKHNAAQEITFPVEEKQNAAREITFPVEEKQMPCGKSHFPWRKSKMPRGKSLFRAGKTKFHTESDELC